MSVLARFFINATGSVGFFVSMDVERIRQRMSDLEAVLEAITIIGQDLALNKVLARVTQQSIAISRAEAGTLWLADEQQNLAPVVIIGGGSRDQLAKMRLAPGEGVAGRVFETGQAMLIQDVRNHPRWAGRFDNATGFQTNSILCSPLAARGRRLGSIQLINKNGGGLFSEDDEYLLVQLCHQASLVLDSSLLLQQANALSTSLIEVFSAAVDARSPYTVGHSLKVADYSTFLARFLGLQGEELDRLRRAVLLHDIGKLALPDELLRKAEPFTPQEEAIYRSHTSLGSELLGRIRPSSAMTDAIAAARHHHERADGTGFPDRLIGEQPSRFSRIIAVANAFYHLTTDGPSRKALPLEAALAEMEGLGGSALDPTYTAAFIEAMLQAKKRST